MITDLLLQQQYGFKGLIFTDALNMKGVTAFYQPGELEVKALQAGNDVLLFPENVPAAMQAIKQALEKKQIKKQALETKVKKS